MRKLLFFSALFAAAALLAAPEVARPRASALRSGPMLGYADLTEATVWVQTTGTAEVALRYWPEGKAGDRRTTSALSANEKSDHVAFFVLSGLEPSTRYGYEVLIGGAPAKFAGGDTKGTFGSAKSPLAGVTVT